MKIIKITFFQIAVSLVFICASPAHATFILSFDSAPGSWVGQGESRYITQDDGYSLQVRDLHGHGVEFYINNPDIRDYWNLQLAAPNGDPLVVGLYENTARWPFVDPDQAGLTFTGNYRGNNRNAGFFEVLEIEYDPFGTLTSFAADFTQYGEENLDWWIIGSLRFNSAIPIGGSTTVPEPTVFVLLLVGLMGLAFNSRHDTLEPLTA